MQCLGEFRIEFKILLRVIFFADLKGIQISVLSDAQRVGTVLHRGEVLLVTHLRVLRVVIFKPRI